MIVQEGRVLATAGSSESSWSAESTRTTPPAWTPGPTTALWTDTQTRPFPTAIACGLPPTLIVLITSLLPGSIRDTVPSRLFATQTLPRPTVMSVGARPTRIVVVTEFVAGSIRTTAPARRSTAHTAPAPTAIASAPSRTAIDAITSFVTGSMRATLLPRVSPTHTAPARDRTNGLAARDVDTRHGLVHCVRDPEASVAQCKRRRRGAHRYLSGHSTRGGIDDCDRVPRDGGRSCVITPDHERDCSRCDDGRCTEDGCEEMRVAGQRSPAPQARPNPS